MSPMTTFSREELIAKIGSYRYWHYPFDFGNGVTVTPTHGWPEAAKEMRDFIWPIVTKRCGGDLHGLRVLDIGCNAGFWSLEAYKSGAGYVLGVDASSEALEQAVFVRDALQIDAQRVEYRPLD